MNHTPIPEDLRVDSPNRAFIVRAVNSHETLLKALKAARISLIDDEHYQEFKPLLKTIEDAISKGEGK